MYGGEVSRHLKGTKLSHPEDQEVAPATITPPNGAVAFGSTSSRGRSDRGRSAFVRSSASCTKRHARCGAPTWAVVTGDSCTASWRRRCFRAARSSRRYELIEKQRKERDDGELRARIGLPRVLIGKLSGDAGSDTGVRADANTIADLLVDDRHSHRPPEASAGPPRGNGTKHVVIPVDRNIDCRRARAAKWNAEFVKKYQEFFGDPAKSAVARDELLSEKGGEV